MHKKFGLITGAGSGVGRHTAIALAKKNWTLTLVGRRGHALQETADLLSDLGAESIVAQADVTDPNQVNLLYERIQQKWGRLDFLFNNAGVNVPATPLDELSFDDWKLVVDTNLTGMFLCLQGAFRIMKRQSPQGGRIVNNGSISAHAPRPFSIAYTATKHAVTGLTKSASLDGRDAQIACGQIDIGNAATDMTTRMSSGVPQADGSMKSEPTMHVQHVADAVAFMAELPLDANVPFLTIMANGMPYIGRG